MRKLILLRGAQGSGKSTFIKQQGLEGFALSPDTIRLLSGGVVMSPDGKITINQTNDVYVWKEVENILDKKMSRGEFIIFDATFQKVRDFKMPMELAHKYAYDIYCIDFSFVPIETAIKQNLQREFHKRVPEEVIMQAYERFANNPIPTGITIYPYTDFQKSSLIEKLDIKPVDLNKYKKIHHIGDIQGCYAPLSQYFANGFKDDEFYIFVGDFLDRGIQNGEVIRWLVDQVMERKNVVMIWGNHETHIYRYAFNLPCRSKEFEYNTIPQLKKANFTKQEAKFLCSKLLDCFIYHYGKTKCIVTHAGLAAVPEYPILMASNQFWKGTGSYDHSVDQTFSDNMVNTQWIQVHGHRNSKQLPTKAATKSYNLEAQVEFGGSLRIMILDHDGNSQEIEVRNNIFHKKNSDTKIQNFENNEEYKISQQTFVELLKHDFVNCKKFISYPHISSYNFTRKAFAKGIWDKVNLTARGLFIDNYRNIVARSYNKFFNLEEMPETQSSNLRKNLVFPITLFIKENGFLGILGFDSASDDLFFTSKSTPESDFAKWFKDILSESINEPHLEYLRRTIKDKKLSLVFEVNDNINDPHIITYDKRHVVLLDAIYRKEQFKRMNFKELQQLAASYNLECKRKAIVFPDWESFKSWYDNVERQGMDYRYRGKHIEGFVVEDSNGFSFKIKLPYYSFWKNMRSLKDNIIKKRENGKKIKQDFSSPEASSFYDWAIKQPNEILTQDIITMRKLYLTDNNMQGA